MEAIPGELKTLSPYMMSLTKLIPACILLTRWCADGSLPATHTKSVLVKSSVGGKNTKCTSNS